MTRSATDTRLPVFDTVDIPQEIKNNGLRHLGHIAGDLLGFLVVLPW